MTTTVTRPPAPSTGPGPSRPNRTAAQVIAILTALLGVGILVFVGWGAIRSTVAAATAVSASQARAVDGVSSIDLDVSAAALVVEFADIDQARLDVTDSANGDWVLERRGDTLRVQTPRTPFLSWFGGGNGRGVLTLPVALEGADADFSLGAGSIDAAGAFGDVMVDMGAGTTLLRGSAESLVAEVSAGRADIELEGVEQAALQLSAGDIIARLSGDAPRNVEVSVSAGSLQLTLPDEEYAVTSDVSAGGFDNGLRTASGSSARVSVDVSAGSVSLRPGR